MRSIHLLFLSCFFIYPDYLEAQIAIPTPKQHFGFDIGTDYHLANYTQAEAYFKKVAAQSDRVLLTEIGKTEEGRTQYVLVVSSPENVQQMAKFKDISQRLTRAEGIAPKEAKQLSLAGKPIVWIDGGLHANETVGAQQLIETLYQLASRQDEETIRILDKVVILLSQVNPDGQELMSNWYMMREDTLKRAMDIPRLYQKYIGHDNNRDFYMNNMKESIHISRQQYIEWMPQIIYNHHQTAPSGTVVAGPPYRDPFNQVYDPLVITGIDGVGAAMVNRLNAEDKPGYTRLKGSVYSTWWNGGLRTTPYFHNMIGILTEIIGNPRPMEIPVVPDRLVPDNATPYPIRPQKWHFRQSIDYSVSMNYAILDYASRHGDELLYNIYLMGKNAIEKGNRDSWTLLPKYRDSLANLRERGRPNRAQYEQVYQDPALRDARAYIIPSDQQDFPTAIKFINALLRSGIKVEQALSDFVYEGKTYPKDSYVVRTNQAFRPHVLDMFEPQDHPNDFQYPSGPPIRPYDMAGWTLAFQMGISFDRALEELNGSFKTIAYGEDQFPAKTAVPMAKSGYVFSSQINNSYTLANDLLRRGIAVFRLTETEAGHPAGSFYVEAKNSARLAAANDSLGVKLSAMDKKPVKVKATGLKRIALYDQYGGSIPSGWMRWILEQYRYPYDLIYPKDIDAGNLKKKYDVILFVKGGIPAFGSSNDSSSASRRNAEGIPAEYRHMLGAVTVEKSIPKLHQFLEDGGQVVALGSATALAYHLNLPVENGLRENGKLLSRDQFYIPGSILHAKIDTTQASAWGMDQYAHVVFSSSPVFSIKNDGTASVRPLIWFDTEKSLRSGWAWGQEYLKDKVISFEAAVGKGKLYAFGPELTFRGQAHGTFKLVFNTLYK